MRKIRFLGYGLFLIFFCQTLFGAETPELKFEKMIGDMRGKGMENLSVAVADDGTIHLLMQSGRVAVFDEKGKYQKSLKIALPWPQTFCYLSTLGKRVLLGDYKKDYSRVYSPQRKGNNPGSFLNPAMATTDEKGNIYVADTGNSRIQIFAPDNLETPKEVIGLPAKPIRLAVRDNSMAVLTDDKNLSFYEFSTDKFLLRSSLSIGRAARAAAIGPDGSIFVAFCGGPNLHQLKKYELKEGALEEVSVVAPSYAESWPDFFPAGVSMVTGPDGEIWFASDLWGKILSLNPRTDEIRERLRGIHRPLTIGFDASGKTYVGGHVPPNAEGPGLLVFSETGPQASGEKFPETGLLYKEKGVPVWGILPDEDGGVYVRVVEEGYRKGWTAFVIKKICRDGTIKPLIDFGLLFAKRTRFHPSGAGYSLQFDKEGNIILASFPLVSVMKVNPAGEIRWEAGLQPEGGADEVDFGCPRDTAIDSKGNIWVVDSGKNKVFCLSPSGKVLLEYGGYVNVDDTEGKGFDRPSGIDVVMVDEKEFLYVGDAGNGRIVKYEIIYVKAEYPSVHLSNGLIEVTVLLPDHKKGYYRGPRFDWSGMLWQVKYKDHTYFGEWEKPHNPEGVEGGISTAEEFGMGISGMPAPLGYNEAAPGEQFIKIGVGLLEKKVETHYRFWYPYKIIKPGTWKTKNGKDWVEFQQELKSETSYGYLYTKGIKLLKNRPGFTITHSLKNIGSKPIHTTHYCHNFVIIDNTPIGPNYVVKFPFEVKARRDLKGIAEAKGNEIVFNRNLKDGEALFTELLGFKRTVEENGVIVTNKKTGAGIRIEGNLPVLEFNFFAVRSALCPEPFVDITVLPGEKEEWKTSYTLSSTVENN